VTRILCREFRSSSSSFSWDIQSTIQRLSQPICENFAAGPRWEPHFLKEDSEQVYVEVSDHLCWRDLNGVDQLFNQLILGAGDWKVMLASKPLHLVIVHSTGHDLCEREHGKTTQSGD
jgi:hypothetical protein